MGNQIVVDSDWDYRIGYTSGGAFWKNSGVGGRAYIYDASNNKLITNSTSTNVSCKYTTSTTTWQSNWCWKDI